MIEFITSYSLSQIPYVTDDALDEYAEALVYDFARDCLHTPKPIDAERFIEYYLGLSIEYRRICCERKVLGVTAFNSGILQIMDELTGKPDALAVKKGTVIIDLSLMTRRNLPRLRFTTMHEGAHWLLHRKAFAQSNPFGPAGILENQYLAAKEGRMDYSRSRKNRADSDRMERQADFLASAILMPRPALRVAYREFFTAYGERPRRVVRGASGQDNLFAARLPVFVADKFNVSKRAALIRLEKLNAVTGRAARETVRA
ncbi:MAG: ImmA/IrrE family metallo-endopeptidase [Gracilibacteraceae bacterium]|jgi:Zn-dependent peptidase ImmA (M78 family)|nr:ImmA/IrrE family metallo-endopeptidase [Gracilibacteraceae bacterium]